jgi:hypothetical protein
MVLIAFDAASAAGRRARCRRGNLVPPTLKKPGRPDGWFARFPRFVRRTRRLPTLAMRISAGKTPTRPAADQGRAMALDHVFVAHVLVANRRTNGRPARPCLRSVVAAQVAWRLERCERYGEERTPLARRVDAREQLPSSERSADGIDDSGDPVVGVRFPNGCCGDAA